MSCMLCDLAKERKIVLKFKEPKIVYQIILQDYSTGLFQEQNIYKIPELENVSEEFDYTISTPTDLGRKVEFDL